MFQPIDMDLSKVVAPAAVFDAIGHIFSNISVVALYWSSTQSIRGIKPARFKLVVALYCFILTCFDQFFNKLEGVWDCLYIQVMF